ncbi:hypothetical protein ACFQ7O_30500 [Streptomyces sp. NPDC056485]|uniref:hypothetical protein n=1 Tax=Streptomyces sp. NPDC056485 TaxID=3345834 RepID=UPI0036847B74
MDRQHRRLRAGPTATSRRPRRGSRPGWGAGPGGAGAGGRAAHRTTCVGDQVLAGGRLLAITDLRYRHGGTRTMILAGGRLAVAERTVRVYRPRTA